MTPVESILGLLDGVRRCGNGWVARCPAHDDRTPSLSVGEGEDGRVLVKCHAGCENDAIVAALGITIPSLFPDNDGLSDARERAFDYVDEEGKVLFQAVRRELPGGDKEFRQRRPDGNGGWVWSLNGTRRVLYQLPQVLKAIRKREIIFVVEGEKCVQAAERLGLAATTNPMGAGKWRPEYTDTLRGSRGVVVIPDCDPPGREHATAVREALAEAGIPVKVLDFGAHRDDGFDIADYAAFATTAEQREQARRLLLDSVRRGRRFVSAALAGRTEFYDPASGSAPGSSQVRPDSSSSLRPTPFRGDEGELFVPRFVPEAHSWQPRDLVASEADPPAPPDLIGLFYPGYNHLVSGESNGSGCSEPTTRRLPPDSHMSPRTSRSTRARPETCWRSYGPAPAGSPSSTASTRCSSCMDSTRTPSRTSSGSTGFSTRSENRASL